MSTIDVLRGRRLPTKVTMYERVWAYAKYQEGTFLQRLVREDAFYPHCVYGRLDDFPYWKVEVTFHPTMDRSRLHWSIRTNQPHAISLRLFVNILGEMWE